MSSVSPHCLCNHFENLLLVHLFPYLTCLLLDQMNQLVHVLQWELYKQGRTDTHSRLVHQQSCQKLILNRNPKYRALLTPLPLTLAVPIHIPCFHLGVYSLTPQQLVPLCSLCAFSGSAAGCWNELCEISWNVLWLSSTNLLHPWHSPLFHMVPPTANRICLPHPVSTVECSVALNHQFDTPCVLHPCYMHLCADAVLLAGFTSHHDRQFLTYLEGHWQTPSSFCHCLLYSAHHHIQGYKLKKWTMEEWTPLWKSILQ